MDLILEATLWNLNTQLKSISRRINACQGEVGCKAYGDYHPHLVCDQQRDNATDRTLEQFTKRGNDVMIWHFRQSPLPFRRTQKICKQMHI